MIKGDTRVHSLYGSPVSHSLSPVIFNTTFEKLSLNRTYVPFEVSQDKLKDAVEAARALGFDGFNVTMPHNATILQTSGLNFWSWARVEASFAGSGVLK